MSRLRGAAPAGPWGFLAPHLPGATGGNVIQLSKDDVARWRYRIKQWNVSISASGTLPYTTVTVDSQGVPTPVTYEFSLDKLTATTLAGAQEVTDPHATYDPQENQLLASPAISPELYLGGALVQPILCTGAVSTNDPLAQQNYGPLVGFGSINPFMLFSAGFPAMTYDPATQLFTPNIVLGATLSIGYYPPGSGESGAGAQVLAVVGMSLPATDYGDSAYNFAVVPPDASTAVIDGRPIQVQGYAVQYIHATSPQDGAGISVGPDFSVQLIAGAQDYYAYFSTALVDSQALYDPETGAPKFTVPQIDAASFP